MRERCYNCGDEQEPVVQPTRALWHMLPELRFPLEIIKAFSCATCGRERRRNTRYVSTGNRVVLPQTTGKKLVVKKTTGRILNFDGNAAMSLHYPAVSAHGDNVLFPIHEGRLSGGDCIDRHGDPDLMAKFSVEYLKQYRIIVPKGRLPRTMVEMMPALHLLVNAAELALKADLIRSGKPAGGHVLRTLYGQLEDKHRQEIERRFAVAARSVALKALGVDGPTVEGVLSVYGGGVNGSSVYMETRYFAEPTTMLKRRSLMGESVLKGALYPIFLPVIVQTMIDVYNFFSGAKRLKRMGADVRRGSRDPGKDQHGDWGLVPSTLGLVVVHVSQFVATDEHGEFKSIFCKFKEARPPGYCTSWMYGGNTLLFYRVGEEHPRDGEAVLDGLECKIWHAGSLGMHSRDLYLLADVLESPDDMPELQWVNSLAV